MRRKLEDVPEMYGGPKFWRGQQLKSGEQGGVARWGTRGGQHREHYTNLPELAS